jgi:hypothetical protein
MTMGNRSRYHARPGGEREHRAYQRGFHDGIHHGMEDAIHLVLVDLPDSGVTLSDDGELACSGQGECHGCILERHGFTALGGQWTTSDRCERHG